MMTGNNGVNHRMKVMFLIALLAAILLTTCSENDVATIGVCRLQQPTPGNEVAVIGESFIAMTHGLTAEIESRAIADGILDPGTHYVDNSVIGTTLGDTGPAPSIPTQYMQAQAANDIIYVIMDGGGNDCMAGGNGDPAYAAAQALFQTMASDGVEKVLYFFYPDPLGYFATTGLKPCLDALRPRMKSLCEGLVAPKCYFVDLRESWNGHSEYTTDGIHPTAAGDKASASQIWPVMVENCIAQ